MPSVETWIAVTVGPLLLGTAVLVALRLISPPPQNPQKDVLQTILAVVGWSLIAVGGAVGGLVLVPCFGLFWWLAAGVVIGMAYGKHRAAQRYALLGLLAASVERSIPLVPAIEAFGRERGGLFGWRAQRLADMLREGAPLPVALWEVRGVLPRESLPLISVGYESGALGPALRQAAANRDLLAPTWNALVPKIVYVCFLPCFGTGIVTFLMLKIVPQFEKIFRDFGNKLPPLTESVIAAGHWLGATGPVWALAQLALTALFVYVVLRYMGAISWDLPGTGWIARRLDTASILEALALATGRQRPMVQALAALAGSYPKAGIRRRLHSVIVDVEGGEDWCESLYRHSLLRAADLAVLQAAARVGNLSWAMQEMADSNRRRFAYRTHALVQLVFPLVVLAFGLIVLFVVAAILLPVASLISNLAR